MPPVRGTVVLRTAPADTSPDPVVGAPSAILYESQDFDPEHATEIPAEEYLLQRAVVARARSERQLLDNVIAARAAGVSWQKIGALLGTSALAAQQRYGDVVEAP